MTGRSRTPRSPTSRRGSLRGAFDEPGLIAHCAGRIAKFKVPVRVQPIDAFPVTPGANATKIQKAKLRELAQLALARSGMSGGRWL